MPPARMIPINDPYFFNLQESNCTTIQGDLLIGPAMDGNNYMHIQGVNKLTAVTGSIQLTRTSDFVGVLRFDNLKSVGVDLIVDYNDNIRIVSFDKLEVVGRNLKFVNNPTLDRFSAPRLNRVGSFEYRFNGGSSVVKPDGYNNKALYVEMRAVDHDFFVYGNSQMAALVPRKLVTVGGNMEIGGNEKLRQVEYAMLTTINGTLTLGSNSILETVSNATCKSFIRSFVHLFVHSFIRSFVHSFTFSYPFKTTKQY